MTSERSLTRNKLIQRRNELKLTRHEVAGRARIGYSHYIKIEAGIRTPSLNIAQNIAQILGSSVDYLFFDSTGDGTQHT
jgi:DNA-binding XRE family transcriptional regulator